VAQRIRLYVEFVCARRSQQNATAKKNVQRQLGICGSTNRPTIGATAITRQFNAKDAAAAAARLFCLHSHEYIHDAPSACLQPSPTPVSTFNISLFAVLSVCVGAFDY
jgi:hypothetical protein